MYIICKYICIDACMRACMWPCKTRLHLASHCYFQLDIRGFGCLRMVEPQCMPNPSPAPLNPTRTYSALLGPTRPTRPHSAPLSLGPTRPRAGLGLGGWGWGGARARPRVFGHGEGLSLEPHSVPGRSRGGRAGAPHSPRFSSFS